MQAGHGGQLRPHPTIKVQVDRPAPTPVEGGGACYAFELHVLQHRLDRGQTSARSQQDDGLVAVLTQVETAKRPLDAQNLLLFHDVEDMVGEFAARHVPDVQLQPSRQGVWCVGHRIAAPRPVTQQKLDILPCVVAKAVVGGELQFEQHHIRRLFLQLVDPGRHFLDREGPFTGDLA